MSKQEITRGDEADRRQSRHQGTHSPPAARRRAASACCKDVQPRHRRGHQPHALCRRPRVLAPRWPAPTVVAKGQNLLAQQIKEIARWHGIPIIENPPLAQSLYRTVEVGQAIPAKLYAAVAEILAFVYRACSAAADMAREERPDGRKPTRSRVAVSRTQTSTGSFRSPPSRHGLRHAGARAQLSARPFAGHQHYRIGASSCSRRLYILRPVQFSVFPSLLLLLTLFRLSLNLASSPPHSAARQ